MLLYSDLLSFPVFLCVQQSNSIYTDYIAFGFILTGAEMKEMKT
jgi:hypothetical protein